MRGINGYLQKNVLKGSKSTALSMDDGAVDSHSVVTKMLNHSDVYVTG